MSDNHRHSATLDEIKAGVGTEIGASRWFAMPQSRIDAFAGMTALVVSGTEAERVLGRPVVDEAQARVAAGEIFDKTNADHILLTRGALGMSLHAPDGREGQLTPVTQLEAADAFGAGDAAAAAFTMALVAGAEVEDAAGIANLVAGFQVGRPGTVPVTRAEILSVLGE